jgi:hypothetical protein
MAAPAHCEIQEGEPVQQRYSKVHNAELSFEAVEVKDVVVARPIKN